jgi:hypothetical protein
LFDEAESDIGRRADEESDPLSLGEITALQEVSHTVPIEFGHFLYYGAALLLLLEWLYALWRYSRARTL